MTELAKITGVVEDNLIQLTFLTGESVFAPFVINGNTSCIASDDWVKSHKDDFLAVVIYEGDLYINPLIIGFLPVDRADSTKFNVVERLVDKLKELIDKVDSLAKETKGVVSDIPNIGYTSPTGPATLSAYTPQSQVRSANFNSISNDLSQISQDIDKIMEDVR